MLTVVPSVHNICLLRMGTYPLRRGFRRRYGTRLQEFRNFSQGCPGLEQGVCVMASQIALAYYANVVNKPDAFKTFF
jgi:hypothetical protein